MNRNECYLNVFNKKRTKDYPVIDNHGHLALERYSYLCPEKEVEEIVKVLDYTGIDRAVVFPFHSDYVKGNDLVLEGLNCAPDRLIGYAFLIKDDPAKMVKELERCYIKGIKGLKLHSYFGGDFADPAWKPVWDFCAGNKWPVIIHGMIPSLAENNPDTIYIHAHGIESIFNEKTMSVVKACPNYYIDTSSSMTAMGSVEKAVSLVGAGKLLYGSDLPLNNPATRMGSVLSARIKEEDTKKILGGNIANILGLDLRKSFPM